MQAPFLFYFFQSPRPPPVSRFSAVLYVIVSFRRLRGGRFFKFGKGSRTRSRFFERRAEGNDIRRLSAVISGNFRNRKEGLPLFSTFPQPSFCVCILGFLQGSALCFYYNTCPCTP